MNKNWISFKELRAKLSFAMLQEMYNIRLEEKGGQLVGFCPIPAHNGSRNSPSFSAHPGKGIFQCFGCGAKGNVLDFAVLMESGDPRKGLDVRKAALKLSKAMHLFGEGAGQNGNLPAQSESMRSAGSVINPPLEVRLSNLDAGHPYLIGRGFARATLERFGVGFCANGSLAGRIAIPLHAQSGELIGYAGRVVDDSAITAQNPKYLFPGKRVWGDKIVEFRKSLFLYNGSSLKVPVTDLVVVEGFPSVWWLTQFGYPETVAIMGSNCSKEQREILLDRTVPTGRIWLLADGDRAGEQWSQSLAASLAGSRLVRVIREEGRQPTDFSGNDLKSALGV